ncbi:hypothetical protein [Yinghuangia sp. YIM S09857]|uniref:hypothetical protein n=1 Tax=Yinghuangia sp. YIM S09857 TaxID=3436929 RepID=UPI003F537EB7
MTAPVAAPAAPSTRAISRPTRPAPGSAPRPAVRPDAPAPRRRASVPTRLRAATAVVLVLVAGLLAALVAGVSAARDNLHTIGSGTAPRAATATDLYYALADMDAQVANVLLIGHDEQIGNKQSALRQLRRDRAAVSAALQTLLDRGLDAAGEETARRMLADLAAYDALTAQARLADDQVLERPVARPPANATGFYLSATALMHQDLLPAADLLGRTAEHGLADSTDDGRSTARTAALAVLGLGIAAVLALLLLQIRLTRRFRRVFNPFLVAATVLITVLTGLGASLLFEHGDRVRDAKAEAFDPFSALARTRAVASDANADESRYLMLPERAEYYRGQFADKAALLGPMSADPGLAERLAAFRRDDEALVAAVNSGRRDTAVGMATNVGRGNLAFEFYDYQSVLDSTAQTHHDDFTDRIRQGRDALAGWGWAPPLVLGAGVLLVLAGVRPRLREYR